MPQNQNSKAREIEKRLAFKPKHVFDVLRKSESASMEQIRLDYKNFLTESKTERKAADYIEQKAKETGFVPFSSRGNSKKFYRKYRNKVIGLAVSGKKSIEEGVNVIVSHLDSPRLDLKQRPLYEDSNLALAKTHYYGGIKKYQWVARPLALHGVVVSSDGKVLEVSIGEKEGDPVFTVLDLLPHLARKAQYGKKIEDAVIGEKLNVVLGGTPYGEPKDKRRFRLAILEHLNRNYGLVEQDLVSAELEVVPAGPARDVGLDRAFIGGYGHDDRVCAFTSVAALLEAKTTKRTQVVFCVDKEEIGSFGNTGARSRFIMDFIGDLLELENKDGERAIRRTLANSKIISADVGAAVNPDWKEVHDKLNAPLAGHGIAIMKYTGSRGKTGASDANAEYVGELRNMWNDHKVLWQSAELGKVDEGGGGTVAHMLARYGADVIDSGPAVLSMHSPFELVHVGDLFMAYKAYKVFLENA